MPSVAQELEALLDSENGERKIVQFLAQHPSLLFYYFVNPRGHSQYVLTEVSLGGDYYMDAVVLNGYSGAWEGHFIEFEPVGDSVFNRDRTPSQRTKLALRQIADWREYMRLNPVQFRRKLGKRCQTADLLEKPEPEVEPSTYSGHRLKDSEAVMWEHFYIITGRRDRLSSGVRALMARQQTEAGVFMNTYDGFLDLAKKMYSPEDRRLARIRT